MTEEQRAFNYSICRFVSDPLRDEALNVGVIVVSDESKESRGLFNLRFKGRLAALGTKSDFASVRLILEYLKARTGKSFQSTIGGSDESISSTPQLAHLSLSMKNQVQLTPPRPFRAEDIETAIREVYGLFVSPSRRVPETNTVAPMTIHELRRIIRDTIRTWGGTDLRVQEKTLERANNTRHLADFWLESGSPVAAFVAIPEDPGDRFEAWARRDSVPTIADAFRESNPEFKAIAVLPPNGHAPTDFVAETLQFLSSRVGVMVLHADQLEEHRHEILASAPELN